MAAWPIQHLEKTEISIVQLMVADCSVSANPGHIAILPFAEVTEDAFIPAIFVTVLTTGEACEEQDLARWR